MRLKDIVGMETDGGLWDGTEYGGEVGENNHMNSRNSRVFLVTMSPTHTRSKEIGAMIRTDIFKLSQ